jgi:hypothetical protein
MHYHIYTSEDNYSRTKESKDDEPNECVICLESESINNFIIKLQDYHEFIISCDCNIACHSNCLQIWVNNTNSCPICRKLIISNLIKIELITERSRLYIITSYIVFYKFVSWILKVILLLSIYNFILYFIFHMVDLYFIELRLYEAPDFI